MASLHDYFCAFLHMVDGFRICKPDSRKEIGMFTDDPLRDFERYDSDREDYLERLPECVCCGYAIQDDYYYEIQGEILCQSCMEETYQRSTDEYLWR